MSSILWVTASVHSRDVHELSCCLELELCVDVKKCHNSSFSIEAEILIDSLYNVGADKDKVYNHYGCELIPTKSFASKVFEPLSFC